MPDGAPGRRSARCSSRSASPCTRSTSGRCAAAARPGCSAAGRSGCCSCSCCATPAPRCSRPTRSRTASPRREALGASARAARGRRRVRGRRQRRRARRGARGDAAGRSRRPRRDPRRRPDELLRVGRAAEGPDAAAQPADDAARPAARDRARRSGRRLARRSRHRTARPGRMAATRSRRSSHAARPQGRDRAEPMSGARYAIGVDFGTESGRAVLVDCADGSEVAARGLRVQQRRDRRAAAGAGRRRRCSQPRLGAAGSRRLRPRRCSETIPALLAETGVDPAEVVGIGIDFTACTMLPTLADGTPLCERARAAARPARVGEALEAPRGAARGGPDQPGRRPSAASRGSQRYGGKISSEWFFAKALQILREAPEIYARAERLIEAADWVVWQLTGRRDAVELHRRLQGDVVEGRRVPVGRLLRGARPGLRATSSTRRCRARSFRSAAAPASSTEQAAAWTGLRAGHAGRGRERRCARLGAGRPRDRAGTLVMIMGTSTCHILLGDQPAVVEGMCGMVEDGVVPGPLRLRGRPVGGRRHLRLVRGAWR